MYFKVDFGKNYPKLTPIKSERFVLLLVMKLGCDVIIKSIQEEEVGKTSWVH